VIHGRWPSDDRQEGKIVTSSPSVVHPIEIVVRDAANARISKVEVLPDVTAQELLQSAISTWKLPDDLEYVIRIVRQGRQVSLTQTMTALGVVTGDVLDLHVLAFT
jgi:hypothetical protein